MNYPTYELVLDKDLDTGVNMISIVDCPAIEKNFLCFSKSKDLKFKFNKEERVLFGPAMIADLPIYRESAEKGPHYVTFSKKTIKEIVKRYFKNEYLFNWNLQHNLPVKEGDVFVFESFITDKKKGIYAPKGFEDVNDGSWFISLKVENDELWQEVLSGEFNGFSVEVDMLYGDSHFSKTVSEDELELQFYKDMYKLLCNSNKIK